MITVEPTTNLQLNWSLLDAQSDFGPLNQHFAHEPFEELLNWSLNTFGDKLAMVTSFGPTGMVLLDHLAKINPGFRVITIDTDFLFEETYSLRERVQRRYPIQLEIRKTALTPATQATTYQPELWLSEPDKCCHIRKVLPLGKALEGSDAWFTGLRRDQSTSRANMPLIGWDNKYQLIKINPMLNWTKQAIWKYITENDVPYNALHDAGYASIGCTHCTKTTTNQHDERSGRWTGHGKIECGIHI